MNFIEKHGNKIAAALCVASFLPAGYAILAQETDGVFSVPVSRSSADSRTAKEIGNKDEYYFVESASAPAVAAASEDTTDQAVETVPAVSQTETESTAAPAEETEEKAETAKEAEAASETLVAVDAEEPVAAETETVVPEETFFMNPSGQEDAALPDAQPAQSQAEPVEIITEQSEEPIYTAPVYTIPEQAEPAQESEVEYESTGTFTSEQPSAEPIGEAEVLEYSSDEAPALYSIRPQTDVTEEVTLPEDEKAQAETPAVPDDAAAVSEPVVTEPVEGVVEAVQETQEPEQNVSVTVSDVKENTPEFDTAASEQAPEATAEQEEAAQSATGDESLDQLNADIAKAAEGLVGTTDGMQCTEVAAMALQQAGVAAQSVWPDEFYQYGVVTDNPQAGNLIIYDNGGRGYDHVAVYIGDGQAVHGNFNTGAGWDNTQTVIAGVDVGTGTYSYLQVMPY